MPCVHLNKFVFASIRFADCLHEPLRAHRGVARCSQPRLSTRYVSAVALRAPCAASRNSKFLEVPICPPNRKNPESPDLRGDCAQVAQVCLGNGAGAARLALAFQLTVDQAPVEIEEGDA